MITFHLTRTSDYDGKYLTLPATLANTRKALTYPDDISDDIAAARIVGGSEPI